MAKRSVILYYYILMKYVPAAREQTPRPNAVNATDSAPHPSERVVELLVCSLEDWKDRQKLDLNPDDDIPVLIQKNMVTYESHKYKKTIM